MIVHLGRAPEQYDARDQNIMRKTLESALLDTVDGTSSNMGDIIVTNPENGQILIYDGGAWVNSYYYLDYLEDVVAPSPSDEDYLKFNGTNWVNERALATEVDLPSAYRTPTQTISQAFALQGSAGAESGGECTAGTNPGEIDVAAGYGWLRPVADDPDLIPIDWEAETITISAGEFTSIGIGWTGGVPRVQWKYGNAYWDNQVEFQIGNALFDGTNTYAFDQYSYIPNAVGKVATRMLEAEDQGRAFRQGLEIEDKSYGGTDRYVSMSSGILWDVLQRTDVPNFDSSPEKATPDFFLVLYYDASIPGFTFQTPLQHYQWDNTQWNDQTDGASPLKALPTDKWAVMWWTLTSDGNVVAIYPDQYHDDQAEAEDAEPPNNLTDEIESQIHSKFVYQEGELNAKEVFTLWGDVGPLGPGKAPGDHGSLTGLLDYDHTNLLHKTISGEVTVQHNFSVYGTGDFLAGEWDILIGNTTTTKFGAITVGGAALALGGTSLSSVGSPGLNLEGTVILANRGNGPQGRSEYVFGETSDEVRFGLPKSGTGLGTYNPRSMIIAGPFVWDEDIYLGTFWGFDKLPMETGTYGADLGVQHDVQILGKLWVDEIEASTTSGTISITSSVHVSGGHLEADDYLTVHGTTDSYVQVESTDVDSSAWFSLKNDAREYHIRITGANELDIYDVTAAQTRFVIDTAGDVIFTGDVDTQALTATTGTFSGKIYAQDDIVFSVGQYLIADTIDTADDSVLGMCGGGSLSTSRGGYITVYGNEHATQPGRVTLRPGSTAAGDDDIWLDGETTINRLIVTNTLVVESSGTFETVVIADGTPGDAYRLLNFNTSRPWYFETDGVDGASQALALRSSGGGKYFNIKSPNSTSYFQFQLSDTAADNHFLCHGHAIFDSTFTVENTSSASIYINSDSDNTAQAYSRIYFQDNATSKWVVQMTNGGDFQIYDLIGGASVFLGTASGDTAIGADSGVVKFTSADTSHYYNKIFFANDAANYYIQKTNGADPLEIHSFYGVSIEGNTGSLTVDSNGSVVVIGDTVYLYSDGNNTGLKFSWNDSNEASSRINHYESANYGFSWIYAGSANPTLDGQAFTLSANTYYLIRHDNSATGATVLSIERSSGEVTFEEDVTVNGSVLVSGGESLRLGASTGAGALWYQTATDVMTFVINGASEMTLNNYVLAPYASGGLSLGSALIPFANLNLSGGIDVGGATGGNKGAGTINVATDIYKNNTAYTNPDYVFEHFFGHEVTNDEYDGLKPLSEVEQYVRQHLHLPRITRAQMGIFERADTLLEKVEEVFLYLIEHEKKLDEVMELIHATT